MTANIKLFNRRPKIKLRKLPTGKKTQNDKNTNEIKK